MLRRRHSHYLVVDQPEEALDRLELRFDSLHRTLHIVVRLHSLLKKLEVGLIEPPRIIIGSRSHCALGLSDLVLNSLAIDRAHVVLAPPIGVQQIDVGFPIEIQRPNALGHFSHSGELLIVLINLILHPAQVLDGFAFAWIESEDQLLAFPLTIRKRAPACALIDNPAITRRVRESRNIEPLRRPRPPATAPTRPTSAGEQNRAQQYPQNPPLRRITPSPRYSA